MVNNLENWTDLNGTYLATNHLSEKKNQEGQVLVYGDSCEQTPTNQGRCPHESYTKGKLIKPQQFYETCKD